MIAVSVENVSKKFRLPEQKYPTLRETLLSVIAGRHWRPKVFWALEDVSFTVEKGEIFGIIGENGAGKTTLLKLILGLTPPTKGKITVNGSVTAMLELGAGFHLDLTGRENIYLQGAILGLTKKEINRKIEQIIEFAELEKFIDVPVKHYSSGMFLRLGFAIAIHTEPDILLVDEVLAVGDSAFQLKCLDKIQKFRKQNKTIVLVSHDLGMVERMCDRVILLEKGKIKQEGKAREVVKSYYEKIIGKKLELIKKYGEVETQVIPTKRKGFRIGTGEIKLTKVRVLNKEGNEQYFFKTGDTMIIEIDYEAYRPIDNPCFGIGIATEEWIYVHGTNTLIKHIQTGTIKGKGRIRITYPELNVLSGKYLITVGVFRDPHCEETAYDYHAGMYSIYVSAGEKEDEGLFYLPQSWEFIADKTFL